MNLVKFSCGISNTSSFNVLDVESDGINEAIIGGVNVQTFEEAKRYPLEYDCGVEQYYFKDGDIIYYLDEFMRV